MADWYYRTTSGEEGPLRPSDLMNLARQGVINPETPLRRSDGEKWVAAKKLKGLFPPQIEASPSPPGVERSIKKPMIVAGGVCGIVVLMAVLFAVMRSENPKESASPPLAETQTVLDSAQTRDISTPTETKTKESVAPGLATTKDSQSEVMKRLEVPTEAVKSVVTAYLAAKTWEERLPLMVNIDTVPPSDSPLAPPGIYRPGTFSGSSSSTDGTIETGMAQVDVSASHPDQKTLWFYLIRTPSGFKINAAAMLRAANQARMNATLAEIRDSKPSIDLTLLKIVKNSAGILLDVRVTNNSKLHVAYAGFDLAFSDTDGGFVGTCFKNESNLRAGASATGQAVFLGEVSLEEIAQIKPSGLRLRTQTSTGDAIDAAKFFAINLRLDGNRPEDQTRLEQTFRGQWLNDSGESKTRVFFSPDTRTMNIGGTKEGRFSTEVTMRNYSTGEFRLQMSHPDGTGIASVYKPIRKGVFRMTRTQLRVPGNPNWSPPEDDPTNGPLQTYIDAREVP